jgi:membrane protease YdiL (CAAX protease family)
MFPTLTPIRSAVVFYLLAIGGVTACALTGASTQVAMLTPAIAALLMLLVLTRDGWSRQGWASLGVHRAGLRFWPIALLIPFAIGAIGAVAAVSTDDAQWRVSGQAADFSPWLWPGIVLIGITYASLSVSLTEEIGWRGYLLPRLEELGTKRALLLSGLLHGVWHLPVIVFTSLYHPEGSRSVVIPVFLILVTAGGIFLGWLRLRSDSVWPSVLAHSSNNIALMWLPLLVVGDPVTIQYLADEGFVHMLAYVAIAAVILLRSSDARPTHQWSQPISASSRQSVSS